MLGEREAVEAVYVKRIFSYRRKDIFVAEIHSFLTPIHTLDHTSPARGCPSTCPGTTHPHFVLASLVLFLMGVCASASSTSKDVLYPFSNAPNQLQNVSKISCCAHLCQCHPILVSNFPSCF